MVFASGQANAKNLIRMEVTKSHLTSDKQVIVSTETLERRMYVMNSNGICFVVEPEICLMPRNCRARISLSLKTKWMLRA